MSAPHELLAHRAAGTPILFWEGLECRRTGGAAPGVRADCARMHAMFELTPLATLTAPNRPFESDFFKDYLIHGETVTLAVYRVEGLRGAR